MEETLITAELVLLNSPSESRQSRTGQVRGGSRGSYGLLIQDHHGNRNITEGLPLCPSRPCLSRAGRRGPSLAEGSRQGPQSGPARPGCCLQALRRAPASPHPSLGDKHRTNRAEAKEEKEGLATAGQGKRGTLSAWGLEARPRIPLPWGQAALTPEGLDRLNIPRDEHISSDSCRKT